MTWFKVSDEFAFHGKVVAAGNAIALWVRAGAWCAQQLTDGFIPDHMVTVIGSKRDAAKLVTAGLWETADGGYRFHDWADYQPTRAQVEDKRTKRQDAGRRGGVRSGESRRSSKPEANASGDASPSLHTRANPRPDPYQRDTTPTESGADAPAAASVDDIHAGTVIGAWVTACKENGTSPSESQRKQVGKLAKELLKTNDPQVVLDAAAQAGAKGYVTIDREMTAMNGRAIQQPKTRASASDAAVAAAQALKQPTANPGQLQIGA